MLAETAALARAHAATTSGVSEDALHALAVPYRICPIGAHIDHQGGPVLGTAIDAFTVLAFVPNDGPECHLVSANYPGAARFAMGRLAPAEHGGFARYAAAAAAVLAPDLPAPPRGLTGAVAGALPGGGLSSSASVLIAYLTALAAVHRVELEPRVLVERTREAENRYVGVRSGILDPASIVGARRDHLVAIDTQRSAWESVAPARGREGDATFLVAFTGIERNLAATGFNDRVEQCHRAARLLATRAGAPGAERLGELPESALAELLGELPEPERRRARHFVEERERVRRGVEAWRRGDLVAFGHLMSDSCRSSIENFEVGSPELVLLQEIFLTTPGVLGARFSGAGFGGCAIALVEAGRAESCRERVTEAFLAKFPERGDRARFFLVASEDGPRWL
jgi:galactokinase